MRRTLVAGAALLSLSSAAWLCFRDATPETKHAQGVHHDDKVDMQGDLHRLGEQVAELQRTLAKAPPSGAVVARPTEAQAEHEKDDVVQASEPEWSPEVFADNLEAQLKSQPVDEAWAKEKTLAIEQLFAGKVGVDVQLLQATCGSTLCRVSLSHADAQQREQTVGDLRFEKPFIGDGFARFEDGPGGRPVSRIFIARQGFQLDKLGADS